MFLLMNKFDFFFPKKPDCYQIFEGLDFAKLANLQNWITTNLEIFFWMIIFFYQLHVLMHNQGEKKNLISTFQDARLRIALYICMDYTSKLKTHVYKIIEILTNVPIKLLRAPKWVHCLFLSPLGFRKMKMLHAKFCLFCVV